MPRSTRQNKSQCVLPENKALRHPHTERAKDLEPLTHSQDEADVMRLSTSVNWLKDTLAGIRSAELELPDISHTTE